LPKEDVLQFLKKITEKENISVDENVLSTIRDNYGSDIRSMINFLQLNQNLTQWKNNILDYSCFDMITSLMKDPSISVETIIEFIKSKSVDYNTDKYRIIGLYLYYITRHSETSNQHFSELLNISEIVVHNHKTEICFNYFCHKIKNFFNKIQLQN
jgi:DNA polymerase III delta prime subunit